MANLEKAKQVYNKVIEVLDGMNWTYDRDDERLIIKTGVKTKDLPVDFTIAINPNLDIISYYSFLSFKMASEKIVETAMAICDINVKFGDGAFNLDTSNGTVYFKLTSSYREMDPSSELIHYIISIATNTVDDFNDKFLMFNAGKMSYEDLISTDNL